MKRLVLAAAMLATLAPIPASAQFYGGPRGGYEDDFDDRRRARRRREREYYEDDRPRRGRDFERRDFGRGGPGGPRVAGRAFCATPVGVCPSFQYPPGAPCACQTPGRPRGVIVYR